jgi:succinate-semialdehyde dehydrogenase/glutarate-semialdehyde dehydrogenase
VTAGPWRSAEDWPGVRHLGRPGGQAELSIEVTDPARAEVAARVRGGGAAEAAAAADAAAVALPAWAAASPAERAAALARIAARLRSAGEDLAVLVTTETGKRLAEARAEVAFSAEFFEWFAACARSLAGRARRTGRDVTHYVDPQPVGVVAVLTPWNFPVSIPARKLAAALAAGAPCLFKPSEVAPLSGLRLAELMEPELPPGAVETVVGDAQVVSGVWLDDPRVRAVSFTGSTRVGRLIATQVAGRFARAVLELGGAAPVVVLPGAGLERTSADVVAAKLRNNGQSCIAANTLWVPEGEAGDLVGRLEDRLAAVTVGDPFEAGTGLGPMCLPADPSRLAGLLEAARRSGARVWSAPPGPDGGFFFPPALCVDADPGVAPAAGEVFGPVLSVVPYRDLDTALAQANASPYGLAGYVFGPDLDAARAVAARLDVGIVGVNTSAPNHPSVPFAPRKHSGSGVEGAEAGMWQFLAHQTVAVTAGGTA